MRGFRIERDETEKIMGEFSSIDSCAVKVLELDKNAVGIKDDFFNLVGDSLSVMILVSELVDKEISSSDVYSLHTVERLAARLTGRIDAESLDAAENRERLRPHKLSEMQIAIVDNQFAKVNSTMFNNMSYFSSHAKSIRSGFARQSTPS